VLAGLALRLLRALAAIHDVGLRHSDIKPANLLWCAKEADIKLADFGLSFWDEDCSLSVTSASAAATAVAGEGCSGGVASQPEQPAGGGSAVEGAEVEGAAAVPALHPVGSEGYRAPEAMAWNRCSVAQRRALVAVRAMIAMGAS
jgi:serine/threonine protein kinase